MKTAISTIRALGICAAVYASRELLRGDVTYEGSEHARLVFMATFGAYFAGLASGRGDV